MEDTEGQSVARVPGCRWEREMNPAADPLLDTAGPQLPTPQVTAFLSNSKYIFIPPESVSRLITH